MKLPAGNDLAGHKQRLTEGSFVHNLIPWLQGQLLPGFLEMAAQKAGPADQLCGESKF